MNYNGYTNVLIHAGIHNRVWDYSVMDGGIDDERVDGDGIDEG
jgi:hypothetical protein